MARLTKTELFSSVYTELDATLPSGQGLTMAQIRQAVGDSIVNVLNQLPNVSTSEGFTFETGSDPDNWFDMPLLEIGEGGISNLGWQVVPMITGSGINQVNPTAGTTIDGQDFDGVPEITAGTVTATENMISTTYGGQVLLTGHVLSEPTGGQANRLIEIDIGVFDSAGNLKLLLGIETAENNSSNARASTLNVFTTVLENPALIESGDCFAMLIRKHEGESNTTVTIQKCALNLTILGLRQA